MSIHATTRNEARNITTSKLGIRDPFQGDRGELRAHGVEDIVFVDHRVRIDADIGERSEDGLEPAGLWRGAAARRFVAAP
jgi:hypothetical protein